MSSTPPLTKHLTSPPNPPPPTPSDAQPAPFLTLTKAADPLPAGYAPTYPYPTHLDLPSADPSPTPTAAVTSLGHKQLRARTIDRPWAGMVSQRPDPTRETHTLSSGPGPVSTSASPQSHSSTSPQSHPSTTHQSSPSTSHNSTSSTTRVNPLARWHAESAAHGPYHTLAEASPPPRHTIPTIRPYRQGYAPSRDPATRGSWDGSER